MSYNQEKRKVTLFRQIDRKLELYFINPRGKLFKLLKLFTLFGTDRSFQAVSVLQLHTSLRNLTSPLISCWGLPRIAKIVHMIQYADGAVTDFPPVSGNSGEQGQATKQNQNQLHMR